MAYTLSFDAKVEKDFRRLDRAVQAYIIDELEAFVRRFDEAYESQLIAMGKIKHLKGELGGYYRLKLRTYRVIYDKQSEQLRILVLHAGHRKNIYK